MQLENGTGSIPKDCVLMVKVLYQENEDDIIGHHIIFCKVYNEQRK